MTDADGEFPYEEARFRGWTIREFDSIDSTNRYLMTLEGSTSNQDRLVAVARHQTAGRGRRGRAWDDKPGASLLFSVSFPTPTLPLHRYGQAVGLAVTDAAQINAGVRAKLKWPNDVLVEGRKLAGVLAETSTDSGRVVVGCGINLNWGGELPGVLHATATSLDEHTGYRVDNKGFLEAVLTALATRLGRPDWIASAYRSRCATICSRVRVERPDGTIEGEAVDLTDEGALIVESEGTRQIVTLGDVIHLRNA